MSRNLHWSCHSKGISVSTGTTLCQGCKLQSWDFWRIGLCWTSCLKPFLFFLFSFFMFQEYATTCFGCEAPEMFFVALLNKVREQFGKHFHYSRSTDLVFLCSWLCRGPDRCGEASGVAQSRGDCDNWPRCCYLSVPCPLTPKSQRPRFQFNTGPDQISLIAGLRHIFDTFTSEAQLSTD